MILHYLTILCIFSPSFATSPPSMAPVNLALGKSSKSSNVEGIHKTERANDGDLSTRLCTLSGKGNWWYLDLGETVLVNYILMKLEIEWNALYIGVGNSTIDSDAEPDVDFTTCKNFTEFPGYWIQTIRCGLYGRFVIFFSKADASLRIFEVEVYSSDNIDEIRKKSIVYRPDLALNKNSSYNCIDGIAPSHGNDGNAYTEASFPRVVGRPIIWYVDLEGRYENPQIVFYCTTDSEHWYKLYAGLSDKIPPKFKNNYPEDWKLDDFIVCKAYSAHPADFSQKVDCNGTGRYALLYLKTWGKLTVREFAVYDTQVVAPSSADHTVATQGMTWLLLQTVILMWACSS